MPPTREYTAYCTVTITVYAEDDKDAQAQILEKLDSVGTDGDIQDMDEDEEE